MKLKPHYHAGLQLCCVNFCFPCAGHCSLGVGYCSLSADRPLHLNTIPQRNASHSEQYSSESQHLYHCNHHRITSVGFKQQCNAHGFN